ncbi:MAG: hypothetical protein U9R68_09155 [Planctomycetota bacterium]|nr:hypothetical protein [Planctomycetota bacterium]
MRKRLPLLPAAAAVAAAVILTAAVAPPAVGRIKLATLPARQRVEIQLANPQATLVEEERIVTLLVGTNHIDFSWTNTQIDKRTILFRPLVADNSVRVIHQSYPPGEKALVWEVFAEKAGPVRVRISYLLGKLQRTFSYRATATNDESALTLRNYMRVWNFSGEEYGTAQVWAGFGDRFQREMGLNESKKLLAGKFDKVPIDKKFIFNWRTGQRVPDEPNQRYVTMRYVLTNDEKHGLGQWPLQRGKARIFQLDGRDPPGEAFLGEDWGKFTPIDDEMKLYLGLARDVVVERTVERNKRHTVHANRYHQETIVKYAVQNFKKKACTLDIEEDLNQLRDEFCGKKGHDAQWELAGETTNAKLVERKGAKHLEIHLPLPARPEKADEKPKEVVFRLHLWFRNEW